MADYVGYDVVSGEDEDFVGADDAEILGAVRRSTGRKRALPPQLAAAPRAPSMLRGFLGLGRVTFVNGGATTASLIVEPQRGFRPERLVISRFNVGAASPALACTVTGIFIGDLPQTPSIEQGAPTEMFSNDATVSNVDFDIATPGMKIQLNLAISAAPAAAETVTLSCGMYGSMMRR